MHYGSLPIALAPGPARSDFLVQLPIRGQLAASMGAESVDGSPSRTVIVSPVRERCRFVSCADGTRLQLAVSQSALSEQLAALLGEPPKVPLDFAPAMDLTTGHGRSLAQHVLMAVASLTSCRRSHREPSGGIVPREPVQRNRSLEGGDCIRPHRGGGEEAEEHRVCCP